MFQKTADARPTTVPAPASARPAQAMAGKAVAAAAGMIPSKVSMHVF